MADPRIASEMKAQLIHMGGCRDGFTATGFAAGGGLRLRSATRRIMGDSKEMAPGFTARSVDGSPPASSLSTKSTTPYPARP